jgi:hypothetical protein
MRTVSDEVAVRLYYLDPANGTATTVMYGTLAEALARGAIEPDEVQAGLFLQTSNDVVNYQEFLDA